MAQPITRYPFATPNGNDIPTDILKYVGLIRKDFPSSGSTVVDTLPVGTEVVALQVTGSNAYIRFGGSLAIVPASGTISVMVPDELRLLVAAPPLYAAVPGIEYSIAAEATGGGGTCYIHVLTKWNALALDVQFQRT